MFGNGTRDDAIIVCRPGYDSCIYRSSLQVTTMLHARLSFVPWAPVFTELLEKLSFVNLDVLQSIAGLTAAFALLVRWPLSQA